MSSNKQEDMYIGKGWYQENHWKAVNEQAVIRQTG